MSHRVMEVRPSGTTRDDGFKLTGCRSSSHLFIRASQPMNVLELLFSAAFFLVSHPILRVLWWRTFLRSLLSSARIAVVKCHPGVPLSESRHDFASTGKTTSPSQDLEHESSRIFSLATTCKEVPSEYYLTLWLNRKAVARM